MVNYHALTSTLKLAATRVVVLGGTQGIGVGIAVRFAELGASVLVMGRNEALGAAVVAKMHSGAPATNPPPRLAFQKGDMGTVGGIRGTAADIAAWAGEAGVDYLFQCQGGLAAIAWPPTPASMQAAFNVQVLSHFLVPYLLLERPAPVLKEGAQVCTICRPGEQSRAIDLDDLVGLKMIGLGMGDFMKSIFASCFMIDLYIQEFNTRYPHIRTTHIFPGHVATAALANSSFPFWMRALGSLFAPFNTSPAAYADTAIWQHASAEWKEKGWVFFNEKSVEVKPDPRVLGDGELKERVWDKMLEFGGEKAQ